MELENSLLPYETQELLASSHFGLIKANVDEQILNPLNNTVNYVDIIKDKYKIIQDSTEDTDVIQEAKYTITSFMNELIEKISENYNIDINIDDNDTEEVIEVASNLYKFLILDFMKNSKRFFYKYILDNKKSIVEAYADVSRKDVTSLSLKKNIKSKEDLIIVSNISSIIHSILSMDFEEDVFLDYCIKNSSYIGNTIKEYYENNIIIGNFSTRYFDILRDDLHDLVDEIVMHVRKKLISKFS